MIEERDMALERLQQKFGDAIFDVWFVNIMKATMLWNCNWEQGMWIGKWYKLIDRGMWIYIIQSWVASVMCTFEIEITYLSFPIWHLKLPYLGQKQKCSNSI